MLIIYIEAEDGLKTYELACLGVLGEKPDMAGGLDGQKKDLGWCIEQAQNFTLLWN